MGKDKGNKGVQKMSIYCGNCKYNPMGTCELAERNLHNNNSSFKGIIVYEKRIKRK